MASAPGLAEPCAGGPAPTGCRPTVFTWLPSCVKLDWGSRQCLRHPLAEVCAPRHRQCSGLQLREAWSYLEAASVRPGGSTSAHPWPGWATTRGLGPLVLPGSLRSGWIVFIVQEGGPGGPWDPEQERVCTKRFLSSSQDAAARRGEGGEEGPQRWVDRA